MTTGNCYRTAGDYMVTKCLFDTEAQKTMRLVHGRVTRTLPPHIKYGHAWVEIAGKHVVDPEQHLTATVGAYYQAGGVDTDACIKYTYKEMASRVTEHEHWGPWDLQELPEESAYRATLEVLGELDG